MSMCEECIGKRIMVYKGESRYMKEQALFKCKHNRVILGLEQGEGEESKLIAAPRPGMARLGAAKFDGVSTGTEFLGALARSRSGSVCSSGSMFTAGSV